MVAPLTNTASVAAGSPSSSTSQDRVTRCRRAATGLITGSAAFWSHAVASQPAASAAGSVPPVTNPKYRSGGRDRGGRTRVVQQRQGLRRIARLVREPFVEPGEVGERGVAGATSRSSIPFR